MSILKNINIRIKALKYNLEQLNEAYEMTTRDAGIESGIKYDQQYPYNDETLALFRKKDELKKSRVEKLYFNIFNYTQVFFSLKDYMKKGYPEKEQVIESFFSDKDSSDKARKDISNHLKHNPQMDIKYATGQVEREERKEGDKRKVIIHFRETWFYRGIDSVEYCNKIYNELINLINDEFSDLKTSE